MGFQTVGEKGKNCYSADKKAIKKVQEQINKESKKMKRGYR